MSQPSAKTEFSNDKFGALLHTLFSTGHNAQWDSNGERLKLIIHGDLTQDINGFNIDLEVHDGKVLSNVNISGQLELFKENSTGEATIDTIGRKTINVHTLVMPVYSRITGDGHVNISNNLNGSLVRIEGMGGILTTNCGGDMQCGSISAGSTVIVDGKLVVKDQIKGCTYNRKNALETRVIAKSIKARSIHAPKTSVFAMDNINVEYSIAGGARAFSLKEIKAQSIGLPVGRGVGSKGRSIAYTEKLDIRIMPYNAEMFSDFISNKLRNPYKGQNPWPNEPVESCVHDRYYGGIETISEEMMDFIRQGYDIARKHWGKPMPEHVSGEIHKRFVPA